ncbi:hypothetical protein Acsp04_42340 [Actinomadura sp. NBRC 104425]|uniref:DUF397 domain-containing protein n=1 Tax=Actinomadura sp. NBRC 104425 TaxID=3032204 RepID=UPI00249FB147|nr:DUF397 domain-containing protein [Actinomadura sp. NBRC 104425]GLZ13999.1 hypothetical protein Acsp04_42340 [Actinomadura sp. NBRC 104425]
MLLANLTEVVFRKSSYSEGSGCVEACAVGSHRLVRDSKNPGGGFLTLDAAAWGGLLSKIKRGDYDL